MTNSTRTLSRLALPLLALAFTALACGDSSRTPGTADTAATGAAATTEAASPDTVTFLEGFRATVFADSLGPARHIAVRANGDLYVNSWRSPYDSSRPAPP